jgi:hypothetical protein
LLQTVQGVGAKVALAVLGTLKPAELAAAVAMRDKAMVARTPGVGPKVAERIVTELKDRAPAYADIDPAVVRLSGAIEEKRAPQSVADAVSALVNLGYKRHNGRTVINLAPAELKKDAGAFDLPIALALLVATGQLLPDQVGGAAIVGELALDGSVRPVKGALSMAMSAASYSRVLGANDKVQMGSIGFGGRGTFVTGVFQKNAAVKVVAICDVYGARLVTSQSCVTRFATFTLPCVPESEDPFHPSENVLDQETQVAEPAAGRGAEGRGSHPGAARRPLRDRASRADRLHAASLRRRVGPEGGRPCPPFLIA